MESKWKFAQERLKYLTSLNIEDNIYLESSKCEQLRQEAEEAFKGQTKTAELDQIVSLLCMEIFEVETSIVSEPTVTNDMIDERLIGLRELLTYQSQVVAPCQLVLEPLCARLMTFSEKWDAQLTRVSNQLRPNGTEITYERGCAATVQRRLAMELA